MTRHSSVEIDATDLTEAEVPLAERPLIVGDQNTVISSDSEASLQLSNVPLSATAQEIRDRLFAAPDGKGEVTGGLRIGVLEVETRIGSGGMGAVFRATDVELARKVALKVLHPSVAADPSLVARFRNEARACAALCHDNVARVFFAGEQDGVHYIAYEYAEGLTLKELIEQHVVLTPGETVNYAIQATLALNHIDAAGIVHRDIKPSNIILTSNGRIKVVDLGLARRETNDSIGDLTVAGTTLGTFDYIAPEQARDPRSADIRSDIYSLGCTVYHMLTGQPPYPEGTALQKLLDHQGKSPPDPRLISRSVPAELTAVVQKMMNTDPDKRYQDPGQLLADLMSLASLMGLRSVPADGIIWRRVPVTRVRGLSGSLFVTGAVVALCVSALAMHFLPSVNQPSPELIDDLGRFLIGPLTPTPGQQVPATNDGQTPAINVADVRPATDSGSGSSSAATSENGTNTSTSGLANTADGSSVPMPPPNVRNSANGSNGTISVPTPPESVPRSTTTNAPFVVRHLDGEVTTADTLPAAWADAKHGDEIELNFDGPLDVLTYRLGPLGPLASQEAQQITIRAARGRSPVIVFEGDDRTDRPKDPGQLFYLGNNLKLILSGIHFQVRVKEDVQDTQWVLFECVGANRVEMRDCTISVNNRVNRSLAVFRLNDQGSSSYEDARTSIHLRNVAVRGACDLVLVTDQAGGTVSAEECAFGLDGSLVHSLGSSAMVPQGDLQLNLTHCTSILGRSAIRMQDSKFRDGSEPERTLPRLEVNSNACVYSTVMATEPLVEIRGNAYREDLQDHLIWKGMDNLYHQYNTFWYVESGSLEGDVRNYYFTEWVANWTRMTVASETSADVMTDDVWSFREQPLTRSDLSQLSLEVFELDKRFFYATDGKPPRFRPSNAGRIVGVDVSQLPVFTGGFLQEETAPAAVPAVSETTATGTTTTGTTATGTTTTSERAPEPAQTVESSEPRP